MLQIENKTYVSDALEDAMRLAQTKAINSYTWSDMLNYLNYAWMDVYQRVVLLDPGYYSVTVRLTDKLTKLPPLVKNSILVYAARRPTDYNREVFRHSGWNDLESPRTYNISGFDLYCPEAIRRPVWLNYIPMQQQLFFTKNNRDPKLFDPNTHVTVRNPDFNLYTLKAYKVVEEVEVEVNIAIATAAEIEAIEILRLEHKDLNPKHNLDITPSIFFNEPDWKLRYISCDYPYIFCSFHHAISDEYHSGFFNDILHSAEFVEYNPFDFTGRNSNVEYVQCKWNDKTGMGVVILDHADDKYKELGWTPDSLLVYPAPEVYRYFVARLADKFAALNESNIMGVSKELVESEYALNHFLEKNKSAWVRITNVNGPTLGDML